MARRQHFSASPYERSIGFCRALRVGHRILISGTAPIEADGSSVAADAEAQARRCLQIIAEAIQALGGRLQDVVRTRSYLVEAADWEAVGRAHGEVFRQIQPASTMVVVKELLDARWRVEMEAEAEVEAPGSEWLD